MQTKCEIGLADLTVLVGDDGTWLEFTSDGKRALIHVEALADLRNGTIVGDVLKGWCMDRQAKKALEK